MSVKSDALYGRKGGAFIAPEVHAVPVSVLPMPTRSTMRPHLLGAHRMPAAVLDAHTEAEWASWHAAEHRTRDPKPDPEKVRHAGNLTHTHPGIHPEDKPSPP